MNSLYSLANFVPQFISNRYSVLYSRVLKDITIIRSVNSYPTASHLSKNSNSLYVGLSVGDIVSTDILNYKTEKKVVHNQGIADNGLVSGVFVAGDQNLFFCDANNFYFKDKSSPVYEMFHVNSTTTATNH